MLIPKDRPWSLGDAGYGSDDEQQGPLERIYPWISGILLALDRLVDINAKGLKSANLYST